MLVEDAAFLSVAEITAELRTTQHEPDRSAARHLGGRGASVVTRLPGLLRLMYWLLGHTSAGRRRSGTVSVSAVGMFGAGGGFGIGAPTVLTLNVVVGGISEKPRVIDGAVAIREILDLTVTVDHNLVDGAPAARFAADLTELIESGAALDPDVSV